MNKILIILVIIMACFGFFSAGYFLNQKISSNKSINSLALANNSLVSRFSSDSEKPTVTNEPPHASLLLSNALFATPSQNNKELLFYNASTGEIKSKNFIDTAESAKVIATIKPNARLIQWAANKRKFIAYFTDTSLFYDLDTNASKEYPANIIRPTLSPKGDKVAYIYVDEDHVGNISVADPFMNSFSNVFATSAPWFFQWLDEDTLLLSDTSTSTTIYTLNTNTKAFDVLFEQKNIYGSQWSFDGKKALVLTRAKNEDQLLYFDRPTEAFSETSLTTKTNLCSWSIDNSTVFCVSPTSQTNQYSIANIATRDNFKQTSLLTSFTTTSPIIATALSVNEDYLLLTTKDNTIYTFKIN